MKNKLFKPFALLVLFFALAATAEAQILNKLKKKVENAVSKPSDKPADKTDQAEKNVPGETKEKDPAPANGGTETASVKPAATSDNSTPTDFIPGSTVLYFDNFEKERTGDNPAGWITASSAEVVALPGLGGKWLKLYAQSTQHYTRNKKQSWGTDFTIEFDLVISMTGYDPRIYFALINTQGNLVTDEKILLKKYYSAYVSAILGKGGKETRVSLSKDNDINKSVADGMSEKLPYTNGVPVRISMTVQGKRFRFWWGPHKIYDAQIINQQFVPNQFGIEFGPVSGSDYYISNIRVAKDIPATRPASSGNPVADNNKPAPEENNTGNSTSSAAGPASLKLQSKILTVELPFAQIMKTGENSFTFTASKEEGNHKENFFKIHLKSPGSTLKAETFNFKEINEKNPLYGTKQYPEITQTEAVLFYGNVKKPYIYKFSPRIANAHYATFVDETLDRKLPAPSPNCKLVIEKIENGLASGYFVFGMMNQGLKPVTKGDAMTETFTDGFIGEVKCTFSNVPVY